MWQEVYGGQALLLRRPALFFKCNTVAVRGWRQIFCRVRMAVFLLCGLGTGGAVSQGWRFGIPVSKGTHICECAHIPDSPVLQFSPAVETANRDSRRAFVFEQPTFFHYNIVAVRGEWQMFCRAHQGAFCGMWGYAGWVLVELSARGDTLGHW